jgi:WD40 repeat protein
MAVNRNGDWVAIALANGEIALFPANDSTAEPKIVRAHDGISLCLKADADAHGFISGGDDGRVVLIDPVPGTATVLAEHKKQWIDHVAGSVDGKFRAYNAGRKLYILDDEGATKFGEPLTLPTTAGGISFSPNGKRLAVSHYNGVSLWWMNSKDAAPEVKEWKGSHLNMVWSPDSKCLLSSLQESALHGWQLSDGREMRMQGYAAKVKSMAFSARGKFLVTSGADQIICWPFSGGGPWGKPPVTLGGNDGQLVTEVLPHPKDEMAAAGYSAGMIVMAPYDGRMEVMIYPPSADAGSEIVGMAWNLDGDVLFAASASGVVSSFTLESVRRAVVQAG